jgi:hypothetical protein
MPAYALTAAQLASDTANPVQCLTCLNFLSLDVNSKGKATKFVAEHRIDDKMIVSCRGSGYVPVQDDGRDDVRRHAINQRRQLLIEAGEPRAEIVQRLAEGWTFNNVADMWGDKLVALETQASLWREVAEHGDQWKALTSVLSMLTRESTSSATADGYRRWLFVVKNDLGRDAADAGEDKLANLLCGI